MKANVLCGILLAGAIAAEATTQFDLSSPKTALNSYIQLQRKGATLEQWRNVVSKENFAIVSGLYQATQGKTDLSEKMPPEDRYASLTIIMESGTADRAILQVKVKYAEEYLNQEAEQMKETEAGDWPSDKKTGSEAVRDAGPGENAEYPFHIKGEGYISYLFLKQDGTWRFHKSLASNQPSDFTPLLKAKDLSGGLTITVKPPAKSNSSLPNAVPNQPLAGRHSGKEWRGLFAYHDAFFSNKDRNGVTLFENEEPDEFKRYGLSKLIVTLPKTPGKYKLSPTLNVTFCEPPGNNKVATEGILKITRDGAKYKAELIAHVDEDNDVRGYFTFTPPK